MVAGAPLQITPATMAPNRVKAIAVAKIPAMLSAPEIDS